MAEDPKIHEIVDLLLERTRRHEIAWSSMPLPFGDFAFITSFPKHSVQIRRQYNEVTLSVYDEAGTIFSEISSSHEPQSSSGILESLSQSLLRAKLSELYDLVKQVRETIELTGLLQELREAS